MGRRSHSVDLAQKRYEMLPALDRPSQMSEAGMGRVAFPDTPGGPTPALNQVRRTRQRAAMCSAQKNFDVYCCKRAILGTSLEPKTEQDHVAERPLKKIRLVFNGLYGGRTRTRTLDPLIKRQLFCDFFG